MADDKENYARDFKVMRDALFRVYDEQMRAAKTIEELQEVKSVWFGRKGIFRTIEKALWQNESLETDARKHLSDE